MATELNSRNIAQQLYNRLLSSQWRQTVQLYEPGLWLQREPDIEEMMLRDSVIAQVVGYRRALIAGRQWTLTPRDASHQRAQLACDIGSELLGEIPRFTEARRMLARAFFSGARFAQIQTTRRWLDIGDGKRRQWVVPVGLLDIDKRRLRRVPQHDEQGKLSGVEWEVWDVGASDWRKLSPEEKVALIRHVYEDEEGSLGYGRGLRESLGYEWYARTHLQQEILIACEKHGGGMTVAKVDGARDTDGTPNSTVINTWLSKFEDMRARHTLVFDSRDSVEMITQQGTGWQLLKDSLDECSSRIVTLVLNANLTTTANSGGSYALGEIQENSTEAMIQCDREAMEETLTKDLLGALWYWNWSNLHELGVHREMPRFTIVQEKKHDPEQRARVAQALSAMGVELSSDDLYEQTGFRRPEKGEPIIKPQPAPQMPQGGGFPFSRRELARYGENLERMAAFAREQMAFDAQWDESKHPRDSGRFAPSEGAQGFDPEAEHWGDWSRSTLSEPVQQAVEEAASKMQDSIDGAIARAKEKGLDREGAEDLVAESYDTAKVYDDIASGPGRDHSDVQVTELEDRLDAVGGSMAEYTDSVLDEVYGKASRPLRGQALLDHLYETGKITAEQAGRMRRRHFASWDEGKHPRADDGKFGPGGGAATEEEKVDKRGTYENEDGSSKPGPPVFIRGGHVPVGRIPSQEYADAYMQWRDGVSRAQRKAIEGWSRSEYHEIKAIQRGHVEASPKMARKMADMQAALDAAPAKPGTFYRGMGLPPNVAAMLKPGFVMESKTYSSWSDDRDVSLEFSSSAPEGQMQVLIEGRMTSTKDVSGFSKIPGEQESLTGPGSKVRVESAEMKTIERMGKRHTLLVVKVAEV